MPIGSVFHLQYVVLRAWTEMQRAFVVDRYAVELMPEKGREA